MFLTVHASLGAVLGDAIHNPPIGFVSGFISHLFLDAVPHGDERIHDVFIRDNHRLLLSAIFLLDFVTAFLVVTLFWMSGVLQNPVAAYAGALGAVLPDVLSGFTEISHGKLWPDFTELHRKAHQFFAQKFSPSAGFTIQVATFASIWLAATL